MIADDMVIGVCAIVVVFALLHTIVTMRELRGRK